jgi:succinyl-diaminopimelate desuccinylase
MSLHEYLTELLAIESPTFHEDKINAFIEQDLKLCHPTFLERSNDGVICQFKSNPNNPTLAFIGHTDVVPVHVTPHIKHDRLYGAGASDMKGGLAAGIYFVKEFKQRLLERFNITLVAYSREEGTAVTDNGLFALLNTYKTIFSEIDCAIVGEPTDNAIQLGCVGSVHAVVTILGKEAHSARPWHGENALYKALPLMNEISKFEPVIDRVRHLEFKEVLSITECDVPRGRTTIPGSIRLNINYRFGPSRSESDACAYLNQIIQASGIRDMEIDIIDVSPAAALLSSELFERILLGIGTKIEAKQAWTDVAQLSRAGIPAFNFGPGQQSQAHKSDEYISLSFLEEYYSLLMKALL